MGFDAGVEHGGLRSGYEVNILICYLLKHCGEPLSKNEIIETLLNNGLVNYFELTNSLVELKKLEQIDVDVNEKNEDIYSISKKGLFNLTMLEREIPKTVKQKAIDAALQLLAKKKRLVDNIAEITQVPDGYKVDMKILDIGTDLLDISLFVPDIASAKRIRSAFLNDPQLIYKGVLALLTGDMDTVGDLIPSKDDYLFD